MKFYHGLALLVVAIALCAPAAAQASVLSRPTNRLSLAGYWPLDDGSGTTAQDISGNNRAGTLTGSPPWITGKIGGALQFTSSGQYVTTGYTVPAQSSATSFTWSAWVYLTSTGGTQVIIGFRNGVTWNKLTPSSFEYNSGGIISNTIPANRWTQIIIVKSGTNFTYYEDGAVIGTASNSNSAVSHTFFIGSDPGFNDGTPHYYVDDVRVYERALSQSEIAGLYQTVRAKYTSLNSNGLMGYWNFNEGSGSTAKDFIGGSPNGTLTGSPSWVAGKQGTALSFNGSSQYVDVPLTVNYPAFTVSAWFNAASLSVSNSRIVANDHTDNDNKGFQLMFNNGGATGFFDVGNGSTEGRATWSQTLSAGTWYHYVGVYDGAHVYAYINGTQVASASYAGGAIASSAYDINIARNPQYAGDYFSGTVDDVRIYKRALSPSEVAAMYTAAIPAGKVMVNTSSANLSVDNSLSSGLVTLWTFDGSDLTTTTATDRSGQGNSGTLTGSPAPAIGKLGQALNFNGSSSYIRRATLATSLGSNMTICAWIKTSYSGGDQDIWTIDRNASSIVNEGIFKIISGKLRYWDYTGAAYGFADNTPDGSTTVTDGAWHDVCFTKNGTAGTFYVDGNSDGTKTAATNVAYGTTDMVVGTDYRGGNSYFNGIIDDVRVYNRALSAAEIQQLYLLGK
ncbi:MAG TPA: LamG domain-containing protein [Candidatus Paceibacterota bacterium]|nr:LamG domain-containing protein [Candidatus Paceibacterota bacterium]